MAIDSGGERHQPGCRRILVRGDRKRSDWDDGRLLPLAGGGGFNAFFSPARKYGYHRDVLQYEAPTILADQGYTLKVVPSAASDATAALAFEQDEIDLPKSGPNADALKEEAEEEKP